MTQVPQVVRRGAHAGKLRTSVPLPTTTVHWHPSPVGCLAFSPDGVYLLSGGAEQVLVMWQLENSKPKFLPRCVLEPSFTQQPCWRWLGCMGQLYS
jgi:WD40 repeat protein